ncbi:MAG TPA: hypothetical protein PLU30_18860 [Verrucomicrobiae bacterium]|nr:hypothetical protein [Verrucomicrobiae bacterium]
MKSASRGPAQVFWATIAKPEFSAGQSVSFEPRHDGEQWHVYAIKLPSVAQRITRLRLRPGNAPGLVRIARLLLRDANGTVVKAWVGDERK